MLMCRNACQFNEPGSQIYKDAKLLKKIITAAARRQDGGFGSSLKIATTAPSTRSKRGSRTMAQSLIAQTAALPDEDEESDDEEEETAETEEVDNPQWQLFQTIRTAPNNQGKIRVIILRTCIQVRPRGGEGKRGHLPLPPLESAKN